MKQGLGKSAKNNQQVTRSTYQEYSKKLIASLVRLGVSKDEKDKEVAKIEFISLSSKLMPRGEPDFLITRNFKWIKDLVDEIGEKKVLSVLVILVKDFCSSFNVVRNMNEDQMLETAMMLLDECGNYKIEDYVLMFSMAKRNKIGDIRDRVDISTIKRIHEEFDLLRWEAGEEFMTKEIRGLNELGDTKRSGNYGDMKRAIDNISGGIGTVKNRLKKDK